MMLVATMSVQARRVRLAAAQSTREERARRLVDLSRRRSRHTRNHHGVPYPPPWVPLPPLPPHPILGPLSFFETNRLRLGFGYIVANSPSPEPVPRGTRSCGDSVTPTRSMSPLEPDPILRPPPPIPPPPERMENPVYVFVPWDAPNRANPCNAGRWIWRSRSPRRRSPRSRSLGQ